MKGKEKRTIIFKSCTFFLVCLLLLLGFIGCGIIKNKRMTDSDTRLVDSTVTVDDDDSLIESIAYNTGTDNNSDSENENVSEIGYKTETDSITETETELLTEPETSHTHTFTSSVTKKATCTDDGIKTFSCDCGESYTESIPATGHNYGEWAVTENPTCGKEGVKEKTCLNCGDKQTEKIAKTDDHEYDSKVTKEPTYKEEGVKTFTCTVCGKSYTEKTDKLKDTRFEALKGDDTCYIDILLNFGKEYDEMREMVDLPVLNLKEAYYCLKDINNDGVNEVVISSSGESIDALYTRSGNKAVCIYFQSRRGSIGITSDGYIYESDNGIFMSKLENAGLIELYFLSVHDYDGYEELEEADKEERDKWGISKTDMVFNYKRYAFEL